MATKLTPILVTGNITASFGAVYEVFATATFTDPATPREGGYLVRIFNGTATVGGLPFTGAGVEVWRAWHSGAWQAPVVVGGVQKDVGSDYVWSDGVTADRGIIYTPGARGNLAGAQRLEICGWLDVPAQALSGVISEFVCGPTATASGDNRMGIYWINPNQLRIAANGSPITNAREFSDSSFRTTYSGRRIFIRVLISSGTTNPQVFVDGVDTSSSFSLVTVGTPPDWTFASLSSAFHVWSYDRTTGTVPSLALLNTHLTNAESEAWRLTGRMPAWVQLGGSMQSIIRDGNETFNTPGNWAINGSATITGSVATIQSGSNIRTNYAIPLLRERGRRFRYKLTFTSGSGAQVFDGSALGATFAQAGAGTYEIEVGPSTGTDLSFYLGATGGSPLVCTRIEVYPIGALTLPVVQPILVVDDGTAIGNNQGRIVGMVPVTQRQDWRIVDATATNGNEQILGGSVFAVNDFTQHRINSWVVNNLGTTRTVSLGNVSAGTQYVSGASYAAGRNEVTLATRFPATENLWVNSNGTDTLVHTINGTKVGA